MSDLDDVLQERLHSLEQGAPVEQVAANLPGDSSELAPLIHLADNVRKVPHPEPGVRPRLVGAQQGWPVGEPPRATQRHARPADRRSTGRIVLAASLAGVLLIAFMCVFGLLAAGMWMSGPNAANTALLMDVSGSVEVARSSAPETWQVVQEGQKVRQGDSICTAVNGAATLLFFEGSRATLEPGTQIQLATLDGSWGNVLKVVMQQTSGKTTHSVVPFRKASSLYQVKTLSSVTNVHGTVFRVAVARFGETRVAVDTGEVQVSNDATEVMLVSGQATTAFPDQSLDDPAYEFTLKGILNSGENGMWLVNGVAFKINAQTYIEDDVNPGNFVSVEGRFLEDGTRVADRIETVDNKKTRSSFTGTIDSMGQPAWMISGTPIVVTSASKVEEGLQVGDAVKVTFVVLENNDWWAEKIEPLEEDEDDGTPYPEPSPSTTITPTVTVTPTITMTPTVTVTPTVTITPTVTPIPSATITPTVTPTATLPIDCTGANPHPTGMKLAQRYGVPYEEIMGWFCQHYGFGEIDLAYGLAQQYGVPVEDIFALRASGLGWGEIKKRVPGMAVTPTPVPPGDPNATPGAPSDTPEASCNPKKPHPQAAGLAARYGLAPAEVMKWFCQGYKYADIDKAYSLSFQYGKPVADILAMRASGMGWGPIEKQLQGAPPSNNNKKKP